MPIVLRWLDGKSKRAHHHDMAKSLNIQRGDPDNPQVVALLREHLESMAVVSPTGCVHALNLSGLRATDVAFWTAWQGDRLAGCGALKQLDATHGEIKSMRTASTYLRQGVAAAMLEHIINVARKRGYHRLSLETGSGEAFEPACALYEKFGFNRCGPFGEYVDNAFSVFMMLDIEA